jgi:hypothetical protein
MAVSGTLMDPGRHWLSRHSYDWTRGEPVAQPITIEREVADKIADLTADRNSPADRGVPVTLSQTQALVVASLLEELAARTRNDVVRGACSASGSRLADLAHDLASELQAASGQSEPAWPR